MAQPRNRNGHRIFPELDEVTVFPETVSLPLSRAFLLETPIDDHGDLYHIVLLDEVALKPVKLGS